VSAQLYFGTVMHSRLRPRRNRFVYRVFFLRFRLDEIERLPRALFSLDRWNLFSFHRRDHGPRDGSELLPWVRDLLKREGVEAADGAVWLQAFPRVLGYVFNPVSFWLCEDRDARLRAVLCEVNNTFREHHFYLVAHADGRAIEPADQLVARKVFHVSPFFSVHGSYRFRFDVTSAQSAVRIDHFDADGPLLATGVRGQSRELTARNLLRAFIVYPWMTLGVILRIHYQALRLWLTGVRYHTKPTPPLQETTR
jgi:DUF1365 family protein